MKKLEINLDGSGMRIGIVLSRFNPEIGNGLLAACEAELLKLGVDSDDIVLATVPGALETPVVLHQMATTSK